MKQLTITEKITNRDSVSVQKYLNDITHIDLINGEEEARLARRIRVGDGVALERLVRANLRFVVSVAKQYQFQGLALSDLINEGNIGLVRAAQKFDETRGFKFISYAVWWIRQSIIVAIQENARTVRLPLNKNDVVRKVRKASSELEQQLEREPTAEELAEVLKLKTEVVEDTLGLAQRAVSLDTPLTADSESTMAEMMEDTNIEEPSRQVMLNESLQIDLNEALAHLPEQQRQVLKLFFGLNGKEPLGYQDVADIMRISTERVRQIKAKALSGLKTSSKFLKTYLGN